MTRATLMREERDDALCDNHQLTSRRTMIEIHKITDLSPRWIVDDSPLPIVSVET
jgi:hypothetical protein